MSTVVKSVVGRIGPVNRALIGFWPPVGEGWFFPPSALPTAVSVYNRGPGRVSVLVFGAAGALARPVPRLTRVIRAGQTYRVLLPIRLRRVLVQVRTNTSATVVFKWVVGEEEPDE